MTHIHNSFVKINLLLSLMFLSSLSFAKVDPQILSQETRIRLSRVPEFDFIQKEAEKLGIDVYLFGGSASTFGHYVRWDLEREAGDTKYQPERFDYDFTNIYRGNQDLDLVVDSTPEKAKELTRRLMEKYPHFIGSKEAWEVRLLREPMGDKSALLEDFNFLNQHTDSNSVGMIALRTADSSFVYRDLFDWDNPHSNFLTDIAAGRVTYLYNPRHAETQRFRKGKNPPILSAIRFLAKVAQYEALYTEEDFLKIKKIVATTDWRALSKYSKEKLEEFALKTLLNAPNSENAWNLLENSGFRKKLIEMDGNRILEVDTLSWWMNKEPLRSRPLGTTGRTAQEIAVNYGFRLDQDFIVSHEAKDFWAYENITRSARSEANAFISRPGVPGESTSLIPGFYTKAGRNGLRETHWTTHFRLHPLAREGADFFLDDFDQIIVTNKSALFLIQENLNLGLIEFIQILRDEGIYYTDKGTIEKFKRKFTRRGYSAEELQKAGELLLESFFVTADFPLPFRSTYSFQNLDDLISFALQQKEIYFNELAKLDVSLINRLEWLLKLIQMAPHQRPLLVIDIRALSRQLFYNFIDNGGYIYPPYHLLMEILYQEHWTQHALYDELLEHFLKKIDWTIEDLSHNEIISFLQKRTFDFYVIFPLLSKSTKYIKNKNFLSAILKTKLFFEYEAIPTLKKEFLFGEELAIEFKKREANRNLSSSTAYSLRERILVESIPWEQNLELLIDPLVEGVLPMIFFDKVLPFVDPVKNPQIAKALLQGMQNQPIVVEYAAVYLMNTALWKEFKPLQELVYSTFDRDFLSNNGVTTRVHTLGRTLIKNEMFSHDDDLFLRTLKRLILFNEEQMFRHFPDFDFHLDLDRPAHVAWLIELYKEIDSHKNIYLSSSVSRAFEILMTYLIQNIDAVRILDAAVLKNSSSPESRLLSLWFNKEKPETENILSQLMTDTLFIGRIKNKNPYLAMILDMPFLDRHPQIIDSFFPYHHTLYDGIAEIGIIPPFLSLSAYDKERALLLGKNRNVVLHLLRNKYITYALIKYVLTQEQYLNDAEIIEASIYIMIFASSRSLDAKVAFEDYVRNVLLKSPVFNTKHLEIFLNIRNGKEMQFGDFFFNFADHRGQLSKNVQKMMTDEILQSLLAHPHITSLPNMRELLDSAPGARLSCFDLLSQ